MSEESIDDLFEELLNEEELKEIKNQKSPRAKSKSANSKANKQTQESFDFDTEIDSLDDHELYLPSLASHIDPSNIAFMPTVAALACIFQATVARQKKGEPPVVYVNQKIPAVGNIHAMRDGPALDQFDADTYMGVLALSKGEQIGKRCYTTMSALAEAMGKSVGGKNITLKEDEDGKLGAIPESLRKLAATHFEFRYTLNENGVDKTRRVSANFLKWGVEEETGKVFIELDPDSARLFERIAKMSWETRKSLDKALSKALYLQFSTIGPDKSKAIKLIDLKEQVGFSGEWRHFKSRLLEALEELANSKIIEAYKGKYDDLTIHGKWVNDYWTEKSSGNSRDKIGTEILYIRKLSEESLARIEQSE